MGTAAAGKRRLEVELPAEAFAHHPWEPKRLAEQLLQLWLLDQVRQRRLAFTKAAELCGAPLARFLELMHEHQITPFDYDPEELAEELA